MTGKKPPPGPSTEYADKAALAASIYPSKPKSGRVKFWNGKSSLEDVLKEKTEYQSDIAAENIELSFKPLHKRVMKEIIDLNFILEQLNSDKKLLGDALKSPAFRKLVGLPSLDAGKQSVTEDFERAGSADASTRATPTAAPALQPSELWANRTTGRAENPAAFIRRV